MSAMLIILRRSDAPLRNGKIFNGKIGQYLEDELVTQLGKLQLTGDVATEPLRRGVLAVLVRPLSLGHVRNLRFFAVPLQRVDKKGWRNLIDKLRRLLRP
jgi:hypothetical protein